MGADTGVFQGILLEENGKAEEEKGMQSISSQLHDNNPGDHNVYEVGVSSS